MQAGRGETDECVPGADARPGDQVGARGDTDHEPGEVVIRVLVEAWQLRGLAADERHAVRQACARHARNQVRGLSRLQATDPEVVEEEEWICALHRHVVDAVVDEILAHGVVPAQRDRDLQLGADAIGRGHQHRIGPSVAVEPEEAAKAPDAAHHLGGRRSRRRLADQLNRPARLVQVDAGFAVGACHGTYPRSSANLSSSSGTSVGYRPSKQAVQNPCGSPPTAASNPSCDR